jgi:hypothetical protein
VSAPAPRAPYRLHFRVIYAVLAAVLAGAAAATIVLATRAAPAEPPAWSAWQPVGDSDAKIEQIRSFVSDEYKLANGDAFSVVRAGPPLEQGSPIPNYVIRRTAATSPQQSFDLISADTSIVYTITMCGVTINCANVKGPQLVDVSRTLRRQALELALYTFKYVGDTSSVLVELPALSENAASPAIFFQKSDLARQLERPLRFTLPQRDVIVPGLAGRRELAIVDALTVTRIYAHSISQDPSGAPLMVLDPVQP